MAAMKETVVVLSLLFAILTTGFGQNPTSLEPTKPGDSSTEGPSSVPPTSTASSHTTEASSTKHLSSPTTEHKTAATTEHKTAATTEHKSAATTEYQSTHALTSAVTELPTSTPKPVPQDEVYTWRDDSDSYCILIKANISINVNFNSTKDHKLTTGVIRVPSPAHVNITGNCSENNNGTEQSITISFNDDTWRLKLVFQKSNDKYFQSSFSLQWDLSTAKLDNTPKEKGILSEDTDLFKTSTGYMCMARKAVYSNSSVENAVSGIYFEKLQLEAFQNKTKPVFSEKCERCSEDSISNLVPIIVGACLGGLIIIVLIAYLIGRKRSRRGYESV